MFNGAVTHSLDSIDAKLANDPAKYFSFLKNTGCINTGWAHGISQEDWHGKFYY